MQILNLGLLENKAIVQLIRAVRTILDDVTIFRNITNDDVAVCV